MQLASGPCDAASASSSAQQMCFVSEDSSAKDGSKKRKELVDSLPAVSLSWIQRRVDVGSWCVLATDLFAVESLWLSVTRSPRWMILPPIRTRRPAAVSHMRHLRRYVARNQTVPAHDCGLHSHRPWYAFWCGCVEYGGCRLIQPRVRRQRFPGTSECSSAQCLKHCAEVARRLG